jgi:probable rRNA maturation factor
MSRADEMIDPEDPGGAHLHSVHVADEQDEATDLPGLELAARGALRALRVRPGVELSVALVTPQAIADLKGRYYGEPAATDVLAFPMDGPGGPVLGDVVICPAVARRQARALGRSPEEELATLVVHGILHLLGREHTSPAQEIEMYREERRILAAVGAP